MSRHPLGHRHQLTVDHQHPVVLAGDEALNDDAPAVLPRQREPVAHLLLGGQMDRDSPAVVSVVRLHHHRVADPLRRGDGVVLPLHQPLAGNRQAEVGQQAIGLFLVGGELHRDVRRAGGDGGLDPLLEASVPELDQALLVEPDPGNPPLFRRPHQRHGAGPQRAALGKADELVPLRREVESRRNRPLGPERGREQRMEQGDPELSRLETDVLLLVLVNHMVMSRGALRPGLPEGHRLTRDVLQLDRHVLQDVAHPSAFTLGEAPNKAARLAVGAPVLVQPRQRGDQRVGERRPQLPRRPLLQLTEIQLQPDHREVGVEAGTYVDRSIQNSHQAVLHPSGDDRRRRRRSGVQVERGALVEDVQPKADQADRIVLADPRHGGKFQLGGVDDGERPTTHDLERFVRTDESGRVLVQPDADRERIVGQRGEQPTKPVTLPEVLVDEDPVGESQSRGQGDDLGPGQGPFLPEGNHVLAQERRPGRRAGHVHPFPIPPPERLGHRGAADHRAEPELVPAGQEDAAHLVEKVEPLLALAVGAAGDGDLPRLTHAQTGEDLLVAEPGIAQLRGGGDDRDPAVAAAADRREPAQDLDVADLLLGPTHRNDVAPRWLRH